MLDPQNDPFCEKLGGLLLFLFFLLLPWETKVNWAGSFAILINYSSQILTIDT